MAKKNLELELLESLKKAVREIREQYSLAHEGEDAPDKILAPYHALIAKADKKLRGESTLLKIHAYRIAQTHGYETARDSRWLETLVVKASDEKAAVKHLQRKHGPVRITKEPV